VICVLSSTGARFKRPGLAKRGMNDRYFAVILLFGSIDIAYPCAGSRHYLRHHARHFPRQKSCGVDRSGALQRHYFAYHCRRFWRIGDFSHLRDGLSNPQFTCFFLPGKPSKKKAPFCKQTHPHSLMASLFSGAGS